MKTKLLLIFDDDSEIPGIDKYIMFDNQIEAELFMIRHENIISFDIMLDCESFKFKLTAWSGHGLVKWVHLY